MKLVILLSTLLPSVVFGCSQNCYLGAGLYSAPLDSKGCCLPDSDPHCFSYMTIGQGKFICRQCRLGYRWDNDKCVKYAESEVCVNPDIVSQDYVSCKVCRIDKKVFVPVEKTVGGKKGVTCQEVAKGSSDALKLANCMASALHNDIVFCHQCAKGFYYDGMDQKCQPQSSCKEMNGCLLSFVKNKCDICRQGYQFNMFSFTCVGKSVTIDYAQMKAQMTSKMQGQMQVEQQLRSDPQMAKWVDAFSGLQGPQNTANGQQTLQRTAPTPPNSFPSAPLFQAGRGVQRVKFAQRSKYVQ